MRRLIAYLSALILAVSCMTEVEQGGTAMDASPDGAPVTISFCVPDIPVLPATKSLDDAEGNITETPYLDPDKFYVVVCGGTQSIRYIRKARFIDTIPETIVPIDDYPFTEGDRKVTLYKFEVQLELYDNARTIHFLGNVDENQLISGEYSYNLLPNLLSYTNKQAYWQMLKVPHIKAAIGSDQKPIKRSDGSYEPDGETAGYFQYIPLVRNFAKIQVTDSTDSFQLHSYAVIFYPERGSIVPYRSNFPVKEERFDFNPSSSEWRFSGYEKSSFERLEDLNYLGNMPAGVALSTYVPDSTEFKDPTTSNGRVLRYNPADTVSGFYIYERVVPDDRIGSTFIILCGKFENDDKFYYYRLDLMESKVEDGQTVSKYYPIYRNFRYNIKLRRIVSEGVSSPEAAVKSTGVKDISADVSMRHLSDISNGTTRLVVEPFMTRTYSGPAEGDEYYELYVRFYRDVYSDKPDTNTFDVKVELVPMEEGNDILILYDNNKRRVPHLGSFSPKAATVGGVAGVRTIRFNTIEPQPVTKTQKIKITGYSPLDSVELRLYREVEITLQEKQLLTVSCPDTVRAIANDTVDVRITIPSELPESMFPLEFIVEPEDRTLTPDTKKDINMPVRSGRSIATIESTYKDTPAFYYLRTLTREEYLDLDVIEGKRTFHCYFKTNRVFNATTIWVYNEYFNKGKASYGNKLLMTLSCTERVLAVENTPIDVGISIYSNIPYSYFPMNFLVEAEDGTIKPDNSKNFLPDSASGYKKTLTWEDYSALPVVDNKRTFYCYFKSNTDESATTIWVDNEHFFKEKVSFENIDEEPDNHFYVIALESCTIKIKNTGINYKIDDGPEWLDYNTSMKAITLNEGQKLSLKAGTRLALKQWSSGSASIVGSGAFKVGGNFASLIVGDDYPKYGAGIGAGVTDLEEVKKYQYIDFFKAQTSLVDAYDLELPMTNPVINAYKSMFDGCTGLVRGPKELPATKLGTTCYRNMFYGCSSLTYAPALPATKLVSGAYQRMFWGCSSLNKITMLGTNWTENAFISDNTTWCAGVASTGEIWLDSSLYPLYNTANWNTKWGKIIPADWEVKFVDIDEP